MFEEAKIFPCPNCARMINADAEQCRFCETPIDRAAATAAAELQSRVNQACSDASYLKTVGVLLYIFLGLSQIPFMPMVGWGFLALLVVLPALLIRWQIRFGSLVTKDADYGQAKKTRNLAFVLWLCAFPVAFIIGLILSGHSFVK